MVVKALKKSASVNEPTLQAISQTDKTKIDKIGLSVTAK